MKERGRMEGRQNGEDIISSTAFDLMTLFGVKEKLYPSSLNTSYVDGTILGPISGNTTAYKTYAV